MERAAEGHTLTIGDQRVAVEVGDPKAEARLRARIGQGGSGPVAVRLAPADASDVEGHVFQVAQRSVAINLQMDDDDDDVEGHAISLRFPSLEDAEKFRRNLLAAGVLAGTLVIGSAGAIAITSQPAATSDLNYPAQVQAYERPAGHGMLQGADVAAPEALAPAQSIAVTGVDPATGQPARTGMQQGSDFGLAAAATTSASTATGIDPVTGKPSQSGFQERADSGTPGLPGTPSAERPAGSGLLEGVDR
jgi:hypothetical protein